MISDETLLHDIHTVDTPIPVHCNARTITLTRKGTLGDFPEPVWYNPKGIANFLSLHSVRAHYRITMDTAEDDHIHVHHHNGSTTTFRPSSNGIYHYHMTSNNHILSLVNTVEARKEGFSPSDVRRAAKARRLQKIMMSPSTRQLGDSIIHHLQNCEVTKTDIANAEHIYGPNLSALKGKTVRRPVPIGRQHTEPVPKHILDAHGSYDLTADIMFVNKIPFLVTLSRGLRFGTVPALPNRQVGTVTTRLKQTICLYRHHGFRIRNLFADSEFEPIRPSFPFLEMTGADNHVPDIERYIRTIKERTRSTWHSMPFEYVPRIIVIHLVHNAVFWLNAFPSPSGISAKHSPQYLMTGKKIDRKLHARLEFREYVQMHEEHSNDMNARTTGGICLGPTGSSNGSHKFMSLMSGKSATRTRWTPLPLPSEVIKRINFMGKAQQGMPRTLTFGNRMGSEIQDSLDDTAAWSDGDDDDESYDDENGSEPNNDESSSNDSESDYDNWDDDANSTNDSLSNENDPPQSSEHHDQPSHQPSEHHDQSSDSQPTSTDQPEQSDDDTTESQKYAHAEARGRAAATGDALPKRVRIPRQDEAYEYTHNIFGNMSPAIVLTLLAEDPSDEDISMLTAQMSAKAGLKQFGEAGAEAITKELEQLMYRKVLKAKKADTLMRDQKKAALRYLMFLKMKRSGKIKGRGCTDGRKQRVYKTKEETSSPTISTEALFLTCIVDAMEGRDVATLDIPGAFMQADMDELVHLRIEGEIARLLIRVDEKYKDMVTYENRKPVIYAELKKALYGTLQAALLFWQELSSFLGELGFKPNPYDTCVMNKEIEGAQCTIRNGRFVGSK